MPDTVPHQFQVISLCRQIQLLVAAAPSQNSRKEAATLDILLLGGHPAFIQFNSLELLLLNLDTDCSCASEKVSDFQRLTNGPLMNLVRVEWSGRWTVAASKRSWRFPNKHIKKTQQIVMGFSLLPSSRHNDIPFLENSLVPRFTPGPSMEIKYFWPCFLIVLSNRVWDKWVTTHFQLFEWS